MNVDTEIRRTLTELADRADGSVPPTVATTSWRQGVRIRRTRAALAAGAALVVVLSSISVYQLVGAQSSSRQKEVAPPASSPPTRTQPQANTVAGGAVPVAGGWVIGGGPSANGVWIWDRVHAQYVEVPHTYAYPAPVGPYVAVEDNGETAAEQRVGVLDLGAGTTQWLAEGATFLGLDWTADGSSIVYGLQISGESGVTVHVADAASGQTTSFPQVRFDGGWGPAWLPGGAEFAVGSDGTNPTMQAYSANTGEPSRGVPAFAALSAWSPDGSRVVRATANGAAVVDSSGAVLTQLPGYTYASRIYWADDQTIIMLRYGGSNNGWVIVEPGNANQFVPMPVEFVVSEGHEYTLVRG